LKSTRKERELGGSVASEEERKNGVDEIEHTRPTALQTSLKTTGSHMGSEENRRRPRLKKKRRWGIYIFFSRTGGGGEQTVILLTGKGGGIWTVCAGGWSR